MMRAISILLGLLLVSASASADDCDDADVVRDEKVGETPLSQIKEFAEFGDMAAQFNLAVSYEFGIGVPRDYAQAVYWYEKSAEQGLAAAQSSLGVMYATGKGVPQDDTRAAYWYTKAAEQADSKAQNNLGATYYRGLGVPRDYVKAYFWWSLAATQGNEHAHHNLEMVEKEMTAEQIAEAQRIASQWWRDR